MEVKNVRCKKNGEFPSPYGVLFILIRKEKGYKLHIAYKFPSPYGVLFILIGHS